MAEAHGGLEVSWVKLQYTYTLKRGDWVMGTDTSGWQVIEEIRKLASGRVDITMESGRVLHNVHPLTIWRT